MRVECESCHELTAATFGIESDTIVATCAACHATMKTKTKTKAITPAQPEVDVALCPKCGAPKTSDPACRGCGLASDRMDSYAQTRDAAIPEVVRTAWQRVLDGWQETACHDEMMRLVSHHDCYAWAAGRYRDAQRTHPGDKIGESQLDRLRRAAEATLFVTATQRPDPTTKPYRNTIAILAVLALVITVGLVYAMVFHDNHDSPAPVSQPHHP